MKRPRQAACRLACRGSGHLPDRYFVAKRTSALIGIEVKFTPCTFTITSFPSAKIRVPPVPSLYAAPAPPPKPTFELETPVTDSFT